MSIIIFDTESTALLSPIAAGMHKQPHLVELAAIKLDHSFKEIDSLYLRFNPLVEIPEAATKVHGITNDDVRNEKTFAQCFYEITSFFLGNEILVGHNCCFDKQMICWELMRIDKTTNFPWAPRDVCTMESAGKFFGYRINLTDLHLNLFKEPFAYAHSALTDCSVTTKCFIEMVRLKQIVL